MPKPRRRLGPIRTLLSLLLVLNVLAVISALLVRVSGAVVATLDVDVSEVYGPQPFLLQRRNRHLVPWMVEVSVQDPTLLQTLLGLLSHGLAHTLAALPMIVYARRLVDRAAAGGPFTLDTARGLRRLGRVVLVGGALAEVVQIAATTALLHSVLPGPHGVADTSYRLSLWWLVLGLAVLAFAEVVEHGCALRAELDEVV